MIFTVYAFFSCNDDITDPTDSSATKSLKLTLRSTLNPDSPDARVTKLRIMAFDRTDVHRIQSNKVYTGDDLTEVIIQQMIAGVYDFVVVANEPHDGDVDVQLQNVNFKDDLNQIHLLPASFDGSKDIPMLYTADDIAVLPGNEGVVINGTTYSNWEVKLERLAIRLDLDLKSLTGSYSDLQGITFSNIPDVIPLLKSNYTGAHQYSRTYTKTDNPEYFQEVTNIPDMAWGVKIARVILPANVFDPVNQTEREMVVTVNVGKLYNPSFTLGTNEAANDYTLPRNTQFSVNGTMLPIQVNVTSSPWDNIIVDGNGVNLRKLNVSTFSATINCLNMARIFFWSNQNNVVVDSVCSDGIGVNTRFVDLAGSSAQNIHYDDDSRSTGYIDIFAIRPPTATYKIYLYAGGLRRELTISTIEQWHSGTGKVQYVGTFHRWNQTGERVIYGFNAGPWTATVEDSLTTGSFVRLSKSRSLDPLIGTSTPGNAEKYQVTDGVSSVSGTSNNIYFRVGLTGTNGSASNKPRYARIKMTAYFGTYYIYVRQGEAADYIMRPEDTGSSGESWGSPNPRPLAKKFSPYNLTDPAKPYPASNLQTYSFTTYPTQGGYLFPWGATTKSWYPVGDVTNFTYPLPAAGSFWDSAWESCPLGYRRPDDGPITDATVPDPSNSEIRQSLWQNPQTGATQNMNNMSFGYYADGYFDRRPIEGINTVNVGIDVAYLGAVIYNPVSLNSVFLPSAGERIGLGQGGAGAIRNIGTKTFYWTRKSDGTNAQSTDGSNTLYGGTGLLYMTPKNRSSLFPIRCVLQ